MIQRALLFCRNKNDRTRYGVAMEVCKLFSKEFPGLTTTEMAYRRNKAIEKIIKDSDPMKDLKEESFNAALRLYTFFERYVNRADNKKERFRKALIIALAGNIIEFGAMNHNVNLKKLRNEIFSIVKGRLAIDDIDKIYNRVKNSREILYVTDNAAELVFDKIFIDELKNYSTVFISPLSAPVQDDASIKDVKKARIDCEIIPRGNFLGIWFKRCTPEFLKKYREVDLVIAKGMGCYETLVDYPEKAKGKVALLMKAKCTPVAKNIGIPLGGTVAKIM